MTRLGWIVMLGICIIIAAACGLLIWHHLRSEAPTETAEQATSSPSVNPATLSIYTSGEYGFSLFYPSDAKLTDAYSTTTLTSVSWRVGATATGTPIVRIQQGGEEVRVGVSTNAKELRGCITAGPAETSSGPLTVGSTTWHQFAFQKVGTDNEQRITSYRTVQNNSCYALELFQPLSGVASSTGYTLGETITSFSFAE